MNPSTLQLAAHNAKQELLKESNFGADGVKERKNSANGLTPDVQKGLEYIQHYAVPLVLANKSDDRAGGVIKAALAQNKVLGSIIKGASRKGEHKEGAIP